jgi:hypothetical protein
MNQVKNNSMMIAGIAINAGIIKFKINPCNN